MQAGTNSLRSNNIPAYNGLNSERRVEPRLESLFQVGRRRRSSLKERRERGGGGGEGGGGGGGGGGVTRSYKEKANSNRPIGPYKAVRYLT